MTENQRLMDEIHGVMNRHLLCLDSYDDETGTYWLISDDMPLMSVTDLVDNIATVKVVIDNITEKAEICGLDRFDFFMNVAKACSYYSIQLEKGKYVTYSLVIHEYEMLDDAVMECMDVYRSYVGALKSCYPHL